METVGHRSPARSTTGWAGLLERALRGEGVRPVFQPIVDLHRGVVVGYEALTRFDIDEAGAVGPDRWFAEAELHGCGAELDALALRTILPHRADLPPNCFLTVNVDPNHLSSPAVRDAFAEQGSLAGLVIEFTEHHRWNWNRVEGTVDMLRNGGAVMAIDDAGAGHSGLQQILRLRPKILKLDRSIVAGIDRDESRVALVEMMGVFANRVDAWILAEGVETEGEARRLCDLGVPLAQGYFFARPDAPWAAIDDTVVDRLAEFSDHGASADTLVRLCDDVDALRVDDIASHPWSESSERWKPVIDEFDRPIGVVDAEAAFDGELLVSVVANVASSPSEIALRVATAEADPRCPVLVTDDLGKYLGVVTMRRLLRHLGASLD